MRQLEIEITEYTARVPRGLVRRLRTLGNRHRTRPVSWLTAQRIAARQGAMVAREATRLDVSVISLVANLPGIAVERDDTLPVSGLTIWNRQHQTWIIRLRATDSPSRQRFTLLHEFKHVVDHNSGVHLYDPRYLNGQFQMEMAADIFASTALMPTRLMQRLVKHEHYDAAEIARALRVSRDRVGLRLSDLNLQSTTRNQKGEKSDA